MSAPVRVVHAEMTAGEVYDLLDTCTHHGFPVVDPPQPGVSVWGGGGEGENSPGCHSMSDGGRCVWVRVGEEVFVSWATRMLTKQYMWFVLLVLLWKVSFYGEN